MIPGSMFYICMGGKMLCWELCVSTSRLCSACVLAGMVAVHDNPNLNTPRLRCPSSVMDCVATHSSRHRKSASIICVKSLTEDHVVTTH